jgi:hypothetical protein
MRRQQRHYAMSRIEDAFYGVKTDHPKIEAGSEMHNTFSAQ